MELDTTAVYGRRRLFSAACSAGTAPGSRCPETVSEHGWGAQLTARVRLGTVQLFAPAWYTTGDDARPAGGGCRTITPHPFCTSTTLRAAGRQLSTTSNATALVRDSDKLPIPDAGAAWWGYAPFVGEYLFGLDILGAAGSGSTHFQDRTGTWGLGLSVFYSPIPALSLAVGGAYVEPSAGPGVYGDRVLEWDAGLIYRYTPNLTFTAIAGYVVPDTGDNAWALAFRTQFRF